MLASCTKMQSQRRRVKCRNSIVRVEGMCSVIRLLATPLLLKTTIFWFHNQGNEPNFQDMLTEVTAFIFLLFQEKLSFFSSAFFFIIKTQWWIHVWEFGRDILIVGYRDVALCLSMPRVNALFFFYKCFLSVFLLFAGDWQCYLCYCLALCLK